MIPIPAIVMGLLGFFSLTASTLLVGSLVREADDVEEIFGGIMIILLVATVFFFAGGAILLLIINALKPLLIGLGVIGAAVAWIMMIIRGGSLFHGVGRVLAWPFKMLSRGGRKLVESASGLSRLNRRKEEVKRELETTEQRLLALKEDPYFSLAMQEVEDFINPQAKLDVALLKQKAIAKIIEPSAPVPSDWSR